MSKNVCGERLINGIVKENPTFVMMLGMCPTLAVTSSAMNGLGTACEKTTYSGKTGYQVKTSAPLTAYIPYSIKDWAKGYNIIEFETVGRTYSERKKKTIMGSPVTSQITIGERTLFSLE